MNIVYDSGWKLAFSVGFLVLAASCVTMKIAMENLLPYQLESDKQIIIQKAELKIAGRRKNQDEILRIQALIDANSYQKDEVSAIMGQATTFSIYFMRIGASLLVFSIVLFFIAKLRLQPKNGSRGKVDLRVVDDGVSRSA